MMMNWMFLFAGAVTLSAAGFVAVAVLWLRKLREAVAKALAESSNQQIHTAQRLNAALDEVRKQQDVYNRQIQVLAQAGIRMKQELSTVATRLDHTQSETARGGHTLH